MNGKKIATVAVCVLAFGGIIANTVVFATKDSKLQNQIEVVTDDYKAADAEIRAAMLNSKQEVTIALQATQRELNKAIVDAKVDLEEMIAKAKEEMEVTTFESLAIIAEALGEVEGEIGQMGLAMKEYVDTNFTTSEELDVYFEDIAKQMDAIGHRIDGVIASVNEVKGSVGTLSSKLDTFVADLTVIKNTFATTKYVNEEIAKVSEKLEGMINDLSKKIPTTIEIYEILDAFNGEVAKEMKELYVNDVTLHYHDFLVDLKDTYEDALEAFNYPEEGSELRAEIDNIALHLFELWNRDIDGMKERGISRVILAADVLEAEEMSEEYQARIDCYLLPFKFFVKKQVTKNGIEADRAVIGDTPTDYFLGVLDDVVYDETIHIIEDSTTIKAYYEDLCYRCDVVLTGADVYSDIVLTAEETKLKINSMATTCITSIVHNLLPEQVNKYLTDVADAIDFDDYCLDIDIEDIMETETTIEDIEGVGDDIKAELSLIEYRAETFNNLGDDKQTAIDCVNEQVPVGSEPSFATENAYYLAEINEICDFSTYTGETDPLSDKDDIDEVYNDDVDMLTHVMSSATDYRVLFNYVASAKEAVQGLELVPQDIKDAVFAAMDEVFNFDQYLEDVEDFGTDVELFNKYVSDIKIEIDDLATIAQNENTMIATMNDTIAYINNEEEGSDTEYLDATERAYFAKVTTLGYANYSSFETDEGVVVIKDGVTARTSTEAVGSFEADCENNIEAVASKLSTVKLTVIITNIAIDRYVLSYKDSFVANNNNSRDDGVTVLESHAEEIATTVAGLKYSYTLPTIEEGDDYDDVFEPMNDFGDSISVEAVSATFDSVKVALGGKNEGEPATGIYATMLDEYNIAEAEWLLDRKTTFLGEGEESLKYAYDQAVIAAGTDAKKLAELRVAYDKFHDAIENAETSKACEQQMAAAVAQFHDIVGE